MREYFCSISLGYWYFFCLDIPSIVLRQISLSFIFPCSRVKKITKNLQKGDMFFFFFFIRLNLVWGIFHFIIMITLLIIAFFYHLPQEYQTTNTLAINSVLRHSEKNNLRRNSDARTKLKLLFISEWKAFNIWLYFKWYIPSGVRRTVDSISVLLVNCYAHWTLSLTVILAF